MATVWKKGKEPISSFKQFIELFRRVFDHSPKGWEVGEQLLTVKQGKRQVAEYAHKFHMFTAGSGWNEAALKAVFNQGLNPEILTELTC